MVMASRRLAAQRLRHDQLDLRERDDREEFHEDEVEPAPELKGQKISSKLHIPEFREINEEARNTKAELLFEKKYRSGYLSTFTEEDENAIQKNPFVLEYFEPDVWGPEETTFFNELLYAYGCNWLKMSQLMMSKNWALMEEFYVSNRYDVTCQICGTTKDDEKLLMCDNCDRGYHIYCLNPPLNAIPKSAWYCSPACVQTGLFDHQRVQIRKKKTMRTNLVMKKDFIERL